MAHLEAWLRSTRVLVDGRWLPLEEAEPEIRRQAQLEAAAARRRGLVVKVLGSLVGWYVVVELIRYILKHL